MKKQSKFIEDFKLNGWIDAHLHLADKRIENSEKLLIEANKKNIFLFAQGGYGPADWSLQLELRKKHGLGILPSFGLHPMWISEAIQNQISLALNNSADEPSLEKFFNEQLDLLSRQLSQACLLGETGLDFRPSIRQSDLIENWQRQLFADQIELAAFAHKPMVLHIVQAHNEAKLIWDLVANSSQKGFVHAFSGSWPEAKVWIDRGLSISIGAKVCFPNKKGLYQAVKEIPMDKILVETDSPDQSPPKELVGHDGYNVPENLIYVAKAISEIKGISWRQVLDKARENFENLVHAKS